MLEMNATGYNIPIFMSETGCNAPKPRTFDDQSAIFGEEMSDTWSGAIIYEWIQETNDYGLISYGPEADATATGGNVYEGFTRAGTPTPISPDFDNLKSQWASVSPSGVSADSYQPTAAPVACPAYTSGMWEVSGNVPLPTIGAKGTAYTTSAGMGASTTTSDSGAVSVTRTPSSLGLAERDLKEWRQNHKVLWWILIAVMSMLGIAFWV